MRTPQPTFFLGLIFLWLDHLRTTSGEDLDGSPDPFAKERLSRVSKLKFALSLNLSLTVCQFPYAELDREEDEFNKGNTYACLGCLDHEPWYGGKVVFRAKVKNVAHAHTKHPKFKIVLERPELGASYRFSSE